MSIHLERKRERGILTAVMVRGDEDFLISSHNASIDFSSSLTVQGRRNNVSSHDFEL
jgi:hypothetical protein